MPHSKRQERASFVALAARSLHAGVQAGVGVRGYGDVGVPEEVLDDLRVDVLREQEARRRVAQPWKGTPGRPAPRKSGSKDRAALRWRRRRPFTPCHKPCTKSIGW